MSRSLVVVLLCLVACAICWLLPIGGERTTHNSINAASECVTPESYIRPVPMVRVRDDIATEILEVEKFTVGAELGVKEGFFAKHNLRNWPSCKKYVLVDLWAQQVDYKDTANLDNRTQQKTFNSAMKYLSRFNDTIEVCRNFTTVCALRYPDEYFDFVFVDARHDYDGVLADLTAWWPKVKKGGIFAGHDYMSAEEVKKLTPGQDWTIGAGGKRSYGAVKGAVDHFFMSGTPLTNPHFRQLSLTYREQWWNTWLVRK